MYTLYTSFKFHEPKIFSFVFTADLSFRLTAHTHAKLLPSYSSWMALQGSEQILSAANTAVLYSNSVNFHRQYFFSLHLD